MAEKKIEQLEILHFKDKVMLLRTFKGIFIITWMILNKQIIGFLVNHQVEKIFLVSKLYIPF